MNDKPLILVCDDESHIVHVVSLKLRNAGYEVVTAQDGAEGLEIARQRTPDLLITDYQMPRMNGVELCAAFREDNTLAKVPAIMLTARGFRLDPLEVRQARIAEVLSKPFSPREVLARVQELLTKEDEETGSDESPPIEAAA
ncbi:MAG: response regulator [Planctomycetota bacterium]